MLQDADLADGLPTAAQRGNLLHTLASDISLGALETAKFLLDRGVCSVNQQEETSRQTALHVAAHWDNLCMCQLLLHYGADPLLFDKDEQTPLDIATGKSRDFLCSLCRRGQKKRTRKIFKFLRHIFQPHKRKKLLAEDLPPRSPSAPPPQSAFPACQKSLNEEIEEVVRTPPSSLLRRLSPTRYSGFSNGPEGSDRRSSTSTAFYTASEGGDAMQRRRCSSWSNRLSLDGAADVDLLPLVAEESSPVKPLLAVPSAPPLTPEVDQRNIYPSLKPTPKPRILSLRPSQPCPIPPPLDEPPPTLPARVESLNDEVLSNQATELEKQLVWIRKLPLHELRAQLLRLSCLVGPLDTRNRRLYERKLATSLLRDRNAPSTKLAACLEKLNFEPKYSLPLEMVLQRADMDVGVVEEGVVCEHFKDPSYTDSFYFCYLLIDPRGLDIDNLDLDAFLRAIFYVGKGKHQRCQFHFDEAIASRRGGKRSDKTERICEVWDAGHGVLVPHLFSNIHSDEAFVREAAMIAALGLKNLTNVRSGDLKPPAKHWDPRKVESYGAHLLLKAQRIVAAERCKPLFERDVPIKH